MSVESTAGPGRSKPVCVVITCFAPGQPGYLDFSYRIKSLVTHYRVLVVSDHSLTAEELLIPGVEYEVIKGGQGRAGWLKYVMACGRFLRQRMPDVAVLLHSAVAPVALLAGKVPTVTYWNEHPLHLSPAPKSAPLRSALRSLVRGVFFWGARRSTLVLPIGEAMASDLIEHGCDAGKVRLQYMGVDPVFFQTHRPQSGSASPEPLRLLYVGTVSAERGRDVMLDALAVANRDSVIAQLTIVGATPEQLAFCEQRICDLGVTNSVQIRGRVPGRDIPAFMSQADVGLCLWEDRPWWRFNPPTKLFEYLAAGLPVLCSNIRTHTQYIRDGENGLVFEYASESLAACIKRLYAMRHALPKMQQSAAESGRRYDWAKIETDFLSAVREAHS